MISPGVEDTTEIERGNYEEEHNSGRERRTVNASFNGNATYAVNTFFYENETQAVGNGTLAAKRCGPDVTSWLIGQMNRNIFNIDIQYCRKWYDTILFSPICLLKFKDLVGNGKPWDFKITQRFAIPGCPINCPRTMTLCRRCVNYDVPGNIHYGWVGRAATIHRWLLLKAADLVQQGGVDDPKDQVAITIGMDLWDNPNRRAIFCREVLNKIGLLNLSGTEGCHKCKIVY